MSKAKSKATYVVYTVGISIGIGELAIIRILLTKFKNLSFSYILRKSKIFEYIEVASNASKKIEDET